MANFDSRNLSTLSAIAKSLQLTPSAVANWSKADDFPAPALKVGRTQAWDAAAVIQWGLANDRIKTPSELRKLADAIEAVLFTEDDDTEAAEVAAELNELLSDDAEADADFDVIEVDEV